MAPEVGESFSSQTGAGDKSGAVANGESKISIPVLGLQEIISKLQKEASDVRLKSFRSMYSSVAGAITTDVAAMVVPLDDHMVHRGHSVFDTGMLLNGYIYELDAHLDRFLRSAAKAKITPPFDRATIRDILVQTVAAGKCKNGILRYWMSVGRGNFDLSSKDCTKASLYAHVMEENIIDLAAPAGVKVFQFMSITLVDAEISQTDIVMMGELEGGARLDKISTLQAITSTVPIKDPYLATIKSTNYLPNALVVTEAEEKGASVGIWLDEEGHLAEGQNMNVGFLTTEGELLLPPFDRILSGCTARRLLELGPKLVKENAIAGLTGVRMTTISVAEGRKAAEMMLIMSGYLIVPVVEWDGKPVGNGKPGPVSLALLRRLQQDMLATPSALLTYVPSA